MTSYQILNGNTYSDGSSDEGTGIRNLANGGARTNFFPLLSDLLADAGKALVTTSLSSVAVGTGTKTFVLVTDRPFAVGAFVIIADNSAPTTNWMFGQVTNYTSATQTLIINSQVVAGSGTIASWSISISAARGAPGINGTNGTNGADGAIGVMSQVSRSADAAMLGNSGREINATNSFVQSFESAATLGTGFWCKYRNNSSGIVVLNMPTPYNLQPGEGIEISCDGTNFNFTAWMPPSPRNVKSATLVYLANNFI